MDQEQISKECESRFQAGGPRVYVHDTVKDTIFPSHLPAKTQARWSMVHEVVYARRKSRKTARYEWVRVKA
jgi:hypothetical protein